MLFLGGNKPDEHPLHLHRFGTLANSANRRGWATIMACVDWAERLRSSIAIMYFVWLCCCYETQIVKGSIWMCTAMEMRRLDAYKCPISMKLSFPFVTQIFLWNCLCVYWFWWKKCWTQFSATHTHTHAIIQPVLFHCSCAYCSTSRKLHIPSVHLVYYILQFYLPSKYQFSCPDSRLKFSPLVCASSFSTASHGKLKTEGNKRRRYQNALTCVYIFPWCLCTSCRSR